MEKSNNRIFYSTIMMLFFFIISLQTKAASISGIVIDNKTREPLIGATIRIKESKAMAVTDVKGTFKINGLNDGTYTLIVSYVAYRTKEVNKIKTGDNVVIDLVSDDQVLSGVTVTTKRKMNTDAAMLQAQRMSMYVESGISQQQIARSQDRNASEVVRRIPGISIIDDKFIVVRGLSQRYNNVWINGAAVPSTEADSRAFSFDIIPASQLANLVIVKSPAPELPSDFTGGLIKISTRDIPVKTGLDATFSTGMNTHSTFRNFLYNEGSSTDLLGFDSGKRSLNNKNWNISTRQSLPDMKLNLSYAWKKDDTWALISAINYSYNNRIIMNMENARFGIYNSSQDRPDYLYNYRDDQYSTNIHLGSLVNLTYKPNRTDRYEFKQIFNQLGKDQYTYRDGYQQISGKYVQQENEYNYSSRCTYSAQIAGSYLREKYHLGWNLGYSYANRRQPDRRIINQQKDEVEGDSHYGQMQAEPTDIKREKNNLNEHIFSLGVNFDKHFQVMSLMPHLKAGIYGEYRTRSYRNKAYYYLWNITQYPDFGYGDNITTTLLNSKNIDSGAITLYDETDNRDSYKGHCALYASYIGLSIPLNRFNVYAGVRYENNRMALINNISLKGTDTKTLNYNTNNIFPSLNIAFHLTDTQLFRLVYGASVNRPEFREVSPSTYYDFDLFSMVKGNSSLKTAYIQNVDLRYEFYPKAAETVSLALFYKHFKNPIEWTYLDAGGTYTYTFENATSANNYGAELEIKKNLDFIGLPAFTFLFNGSLIHSRIQFSDKSLQRDRAMQGQSPYIINAGLFYNTEKLGLNVGVLYNRVGKRIVGVGRVDTSSGASINNDIPDAYEMPRDVLDISVTKKIGKLFELKGSVRDLLSNDVIFKQYPKYYDSNNVLQHRSQVTKRYNPGPNLLLAVSMNF
jgi:TonB-dependent receptor